MTFHSHKKIIRAGDTRPARALNMARPVRAARRSESSDGPTMSSGSHFTTVKDFLSKLATEGSHDAPVAIEDDAEPSAEEEVDEVKTTIDVTSLPPQGLPAVPQESPKAVDDQSTITSPHAAAEDDAFTDAVRTNIKRKASRSPSPARSAQRVRVGAESPLFVPIDEMTPPETPTNTKTLDHRFSPSFTGVVETIEPTSPSYSIESPQQETTSPAAFTLHSPASNHVQGQIYASPPALILGSPTVNYEQEQSVYSPPALSLASPAVGYGQTTLPATPAVEDTPRSPFSSPSPPSKAARNQVTKAHKEADSIRKDAIQTRKASKQAAAAADARKAREEAEEARKAHKRANARSASDATGMANIAMFVNALNATNPLRPENATDRLSATAHKLLKKQRALIHSFDAYENETYDPSGYDQAGTRALREFVNGLRGQLVEIEMDLGEFETLKEKVE